MAGKPMNFCLILIASFIGSYASTCVQPQVRSNVYMSSETQMSTSAVTIVDFTLKCKDGAENLLLYAEFNGKVAPVSVLTGIGNRYQVSFTDEQKSLHKGDYKVRLFDEQHYSAYRKAMRDGEDTSKASHLYSIDVKYQGVSRGPWVQSELIAVLVAALVCQYAYTTRCRLQS